MRFGQVLAAALIAMFAFAALGAAIDAFRKFTTGKEGRVLGVVSLAYAGVETATPPSPRRHPAVPPRGVVVEMHGLQLVSTGTRLVSIESDEGEAIARENAVNLRSDGSVRHRQHHPTCFPRC